MSSFQKYSLVPSPRWYRMAPSEPANSIRGTKFPAGCAVTCENSMADGFNLSLKRSLPLRVVRNAPQSDATIHTQEGPFSRPWILRRNHNRCGDKPAQCTFQ